MSSPIETIYPAAFTLYAVLHGVVGGVRKVWNPTLLAGAGDWETFNAANWAQYPVALTEDAGSGYYAATYPANISGVLTTEAVYLQGGGSPAIGDTPLGIGQSQGESVAALAGDLTAAANLAASCKGMITGLVAGVPTTASVPTNLPDVVDNVYQGRLIVFLTGAATRQAALIQAYDFASQTLTLVGTLASAPAAGDAFIIL